MRRRVRSGAIRGTSPYLGRKGGDLSVYAKRLGRLPSRPQFDSTANPAPDQPIAGVSPYDEAAGAVVAAEAPRLYHGLPSGEEGEDIPVESARAIDHLATELMALEGRLQSRTVPDSASAGLAARREPSSSGYPRSPRVEVDPCSREGEGSPNRPAPGEEDEQQSLDAESRRWDEFGRDTRASERFSPIARFLAKRYFRTV